MPSPSSGEPPPMRSKGRNVKATCPVCKKDYKALMQHLHSEHADVDFTDDQLAGAGLRACICGYPCSTDLGVKLHMSRSLHHDRMADRAERTDEQPINAS